MSTLSGEPGGTRSFDEGSGSLFAQITRLEQARREIARLAFWVRLAGGALVVGLLLGVLMWVVR